MKIVCESCSAKYSVADEKVVGRTFKIRCKKCGAAIVVRSEAAAPAASFDYGGDAGWHVLVDGEQRGPLTPQQLGQLISASTIGWDAYVWREGLADWKAAQDVDELVQAIMQPAPSRDAGADLFAAREASPFGGGDDDVIASAPSPRAAAQAATGQRNENSVLFSLSNLQALSTAAPTTAAPSEPIAPKSGTASGDGSGLIDIRALASATGLTGGSSAPSPTAGSPPKLDDLLSIGAPSVGLGSGLAAPVIIAEKEERRSRGGGGMIAAAAIVAVAILGGAGVFAYVSLHQADPAAGHAVAMIAPVATTVAVAPVVQALPPPTSTAVAPPETTVAVAPEAHPTTPRPGRRPPTAPVAPPASVTPPSTSRPPPSTDLDVLLHQAIRPHPSDAPTTVAAPSGPTTPSSGDVRSALNGVQAAVAACGAGEHGIATVQVSFTGATGHVSAAVVNGQFAGTPVGSCIARAVRSAILPPFRQATFSVSYPFRI